MIRIHFGNLNQTKHIDNENMWLKIRQKHADNIEMIGSIYYVQTADGSWGIWNFVVSKVVKLNSWLKERQYIIKYYSIFTPNCILFIE